MLRRDGYLVSTLGGTLLRIAEVTALVRASTLDLTLQEKGSLLAAAIPLERLLQADQHKHFTYLLDGPPTDARPALHSRATLLRAGLPSRSSTEQCCDEP